LTDPYDLNRFVAVQADTYETSLRELTLGRKRSDWMWFVFPHLRGLGHSAMATRYGIGSLDEARAYLAHPLLGPRLRACVAGLQDHVGLSASQVFGEVDAIKLRSSLTLFAEAGGEPLFHAALARWCGEPDPATLRLLASEVAEADRSAS
jgi:uncharacterized protein (DUF1810 family)